MLALPRASLGKNICHALLGLGQDRVQRVQRHVLFPLLQALQEVAGSNPVGPIILRRRMGR